MDQISLNPSYPIFFECIYNISEQSEPLYDPTFFSGQIYTCRIWIKIAFIEYTNSSLIGQKLWSTFYKIHQYTINCPQFWSCKQSTIRLITINSTLFFNIPGKNLSFASNIKSILNRKKKTSISIIITRPYHLNKSTMKDRVITYS